MADDYDYEHVKTFPTYGSKLRDLERFSNISYNTNDPIALWCRTNAKSHVGFFFIDLCIILNKYLQYYDHLTPVDSKHCEYLSYWLNKKRNNNDTFSLYTKILEGNNSLNIFDERISNTGTCRSKLVNLSNEVVKNINKLNELNEQYLFLITKYKIGESTDDELCRYAEKFAELYNSAIMECFKDYNNKYCNELIEFKVRFNKYKSFTDTCPLIQPLRSIPGAMSQELDAIKKYSHIQEIVSTYPMGTLWTVLKVLGGVAVLLLIAKFTPLKSLLRSREQKKKRGFYGGGDEKDEDESYGYGSYGDGSYGDNSYGYGSYGGISNMDKSYTDDSYGDRSYNDESYRDRSYNDEPYRDRSYNDEPYRDRSYNDEPYRDRSYNDESYRDRSYNDESYHDRSFQDRSSRDRSPRDRSSQGRVYNSDSYYYEDEEPREHNMGYNMQYYSSGNNYY